MKPWKNVWRLLTSSMHGEAGMSTVEIYAAGAIKLLLIGAGAAWTVMGLYFYKFAPGSWFELSGTQQDWNNFGTFVGGMLGPFFGFLAFCGVVFTVVLQAKQLDLAEKRAGTEEIQRVLASLSARIDSQLLAAPRLRSDDYLKLGSPQTLFDLLATVGEIGIWRATAAEGWSRYQFEEEDLQAIHDSCRREMQQLRIDFHSLAWCLNKYAVQDGSSDVREFYIDRYVMQVLWLHVIGAPLSAYLHSFYTPETVLRELRANGEEKERQRRQPKEQDAFNETKPPSAEIKP